jgi:hypothetical protein
MESKIWKFNKGEWSEAYVFLKLLADGRIYGADNNEEKNLSTYIDILNLLKFEKKKTFKFVRTGEGSNCLITAYENGDKFIVKTAPELEHKASRLYYAIKNTKPTGKRKTFSVQELQDFLQEFRFTSPKVPSIPKDKQILYGKKSDIVITMRDSIDKAVSMEGFSIKSRLGSNPTLFNSAIASALVYEVEDCTDEIMHAINALDEFSGKMIPALRDTYDLKLRFVGSQPVNGVQIFARNVMYVDTQMLRILSVLMLIQTGYLTEACSMSKDLARELAYFNPLDFPDPESFYAAKLKDFHFAAFSGMTASEAWDGKRKLSGGYINVDRNGDLLYYRAISDDIFCTYLFDHLYFDRPDRGYKKDIAVAEGKAFQEGRELTDKERHDLTYKLNDDGKEVHRNPKGDWGYIYKQDGRYFLNINFQTRFR